MKRTKRTTSPQVKSTASPRRSRARRTPAATRPLRRRDILDRAARLMQEKGYGGISAQDIADALEFSKANFFYHVKSKEDLLYHIFVDTYEFAIRHYEEILRRDAPAADKLRALIDFYVRLMTEHGAVMQVWFKERAHLTPEHEAEALRFERRIQALMSEFYTEAIRRGEFRDINPRLAAISVFGMCFALTKWPELHQQFSITELTEQMQQLAHGALVRKERSRET